MAEFKEAVLTRKGIALLAKAQAEKATIQFTRCVTGNGTYIDGDDIASQTALKNQQQEFAPTTISRQNETNVYVRFSITNYTDSGALAHGYYITEIGLIALDPDEGEILYGIAVGEEGKCDYLPAYNSLLPAVIGVDFLIEVSNAEHVTITTNLSAYASNADLAAKGDALGYDETTGVLTLKSNGKVISEVTIKISGIALASKSDVVAVAKELMSQTGAGGTVLPGASLASEEDVVSIAEELMNQPGMGNVEVGIRTATDNEVGEVISGLDNIL